MPRLATARARTQPKDRRVLTERRVVSTLGGAVWTAKLIGEILPGARCLLDWLHADEHLAETAMTAPDGPSGEASAYIA